MYCLHFFPLCKQYFCPFVGLASKGFWWDLPIAVSLAVNAVMFGLTVWRILSLDKQQRDLGIVSGQRSHEMDRFVSIRHFQFLCKVIVYPKYSKH